MTRLHASVVVLASAALLGVQAPPAQQSPHHEFTVLARRYAFEPARLEVHQGDTVRIVLRSADIPHSFVVDALRIAKRVSPDRTVTFEFLADRAGEFLVLLQSDARRRVPQHDGTPCRSPLDACGEGRLVTAAPHID